MQISAINTASVSDAATSPVQGKSNEVSKDAFLQLLVAQVKNQDPLNPTDGVQFLSQLAQFSQLEQLIGIKDELASLVDKAGVAQEVGNGGNS